MRKISDVQEKMNALMFRQNFYLEKQKELPTWHQACTRYKIRIRRNIDLSLIQLGLQP